MKNFTRRNFIKQSAAGAASFVGTMFLPSAILADKEENILGPIDLGKSGVKVTRLAMGTGSQGSNKSSKQTRMGMEKFIELMQHGYDSGIRFFDAADTYGSHPYLKESFKYIPREKVTLLSKLWNRPANWSNFTTAQNAVDRFRKELGIDYIDIVLMHCMVEPDWDERYKKVRDDLAELREKGVIKTFGVSCHSFDALQRAVKSDWVEVILARINHRGTYMDHMPDVVVQTLKEARKKGKGIIGMKIYGNGRFKTEEERDKSLQFVWSSDAVEAMTIGFSEPAHVDDTINKMKKIFKEIKSTKK